MCVAAVPTALLKNDCLALARQCQGTTGLGLAHRVVGIVALAFYFLPHMNYVRMGQRDLRQMPYSAYRWVARVPQVLYRCAVRRLQAMWGGLAGGCSQRGAAAQGHLCCRCTCKHSCPLPAGPAQAAHRTLCFWCSSTARPLWLCSASSQAGTSCTNGCGSRSALLHADLTSQWVSLYQIAHSSLETTLCPSSAGLGAP